MGPTLQYEYRKTPALLGHISAQLEARWDVSGVKGVLARHLSKSVHFSSTTPISSLVFLVMAMKMVSATALAYSHFPLKN